MMTLFESAPAANESTLGSKPLVVCPGGFVRDDSERKMVCQREVCQRCGIEHPVKNWVMFSYMEDRLRVGFAPVCAPCYLAECDRIEANRRRRRG